MKKLRLTDVEKLTRLVYRKREQEMYDFLRTIDGITHIRVREIDKNDRVLYFTHNYILYVIFAGSDDIPDWVENFEVIPEPELYYGFRGYAVPAEKAADIIESDTEAEYNGVVVAGHSRGGAIAQNFFRQTKCLVPRIYGWSFGNPGGGGKRFALHMENCKFVNFDIKGDVATKLNPLKVDIGRTVDLPRQISGFFNRIRRMFKGELNHRSYECIGKISPWMHMDAMGNIEYEK
jgi:hypothetical protein